MLLEDESCKQVLHYLLMSVELLRSGNEIQSMRPEAGLAYILINIPMLCILVPMLIYCLMRTVIYLKCYTFAICKLRYTSMPKAQLQALMAYNLPFSAPIHIWRLYKLEATKVHVQLYFKVICIDYVTKYYSDTYNWRWSAQCLNNKRLKVYRCIQYSQRQINEQL